MNSTSGVLFPPNRSKKNIWIFSIAFGIMLVIGLLLTLAGLSDDGDENNFLVPGIAMTTLGLVFFILGRSQSRNVVYYVGSKEIILKRGKKELIFPFTEVESIIELEEKKAEEIIKELSNKSKLEQLKETQEAFSSFSYDKLKNAFKMQAEAHKFFNYMSVPIVYRTDKYEVTYDKVNIPCDCILILLKNKEGYFISPKDIKGFIQEANKQLRVKN